jgi:hypothetical protein
MQKLSRAFKVALKLSDEPAYAVAQRARIHPATLSKLISGAERLRQDDPRIVAVGRELGLTAAECFEPGGEK